MIGPPVIPRGDVQRYDHAAEDRHRGVILDLYHRLHPDPDWKVDFASGVAAQVLVRWSEQAQLLVLGHTVGSRDFLHPHRCRPQCLKHAHCPVAIIPAFTGAARKKVGSA